MLTAAVQYRRRAASGVHLSGAELGLFENVERLANIVKWTGIGVLALAGAVILFKVSDLMFGD